MHNRSTSAQRISAAILAGAFAIITIWGSAFTTRAAAFAGAAGATPARAPMAAPLKPEWVEALLDARATALQALLAAHDLATARHPLPAAGSARDQAAAPLKPEWVEALLDARATALRALLDAHDIAATRRIP